MRAFVCCLIVALLYGAPARAQETSVPDSVPSVTVRGDGIKTVKPDFARLTVSVTTTAPDLKQAVDLHTTKASRALALLTSMKDRGITVERSDFTLNQYGPGDKAAGDQQYVADTSFEIRVDALDKFNAALSALVDSGLLEVSSSSFEVRDSAGTLNDARRDAIVAAQRSADAYGSAGGFRLVSLAKVLDVTPESFSGLASSARAFSSTSSTVALAPPATIAFRASVVATWRIAPR